MHHTVLCQGVSHFIRVLGLQSSFVAQKFSKNDRKAVCLIEFNCVVNWEFALDVLLLNGSFHLFDQVFCQSWESELGHQHQRCLSKSVFGVDPEL